MKVAIIDDEISQQNILEKYLQEWASRKDKGISADKFNNSESFLFSWEEERDYDLLILDIEMGQMNGLELAKRIRSNDSKVPILFVTGYDEYMQYGYDVSALHYLIKPLKREKFFEILDRCQEKNEVSDRILVTTVDGLRSIEKKEIVFIEANGHQATLHLYNKTIVAKEALGSFEKLLKGNDTFLKCHRAYIVNLNYAAMLQKTDILMDNNEKIPVSRNLLKSVQNTFLQYYRNVLRKE